MSYLIFRNNKATKILLKNYLVWIILIHFLGFCSPFTIQSQQLSEAQIKTVYIYNFFSYLEWPKSKTSDNYKIGFTGNDPEVLKELQNLSKNKKVGGKPILVKSINLDDTIPEIHMLYIAESENLNFKNIALRFHGRSTLLISNNIRNKTMTMINLVPKDENKIHFEINKPNIVFARIKISPKILLRGGTELDVAELYNQMETEMQDLRNTIQEQQKTYIELNKKVQIQNILISEQELQLSKIHLRYSMISDSLLTLSLELNHKQDLLQKKEQEYLLLNSKITEYNNYLTLQKDSIRERNKEILDRERKLSMQNEILKRQQDKLELQQIKEEEQVATIQKQFYLNIIVGIVLIFALIIIIQYFRANREQIKANKVISKQNQELKNAAEELHKAKDSAETANKAKTDFLSNMSHELRTPLNAILGYSHMLQKDKNLSDKQIRNLSTVYASGSHLLSIINDILDFGKIEAGKLELEPSGFNLDKLLQTVYHISLIKAEEKDIYLNFVKKSPIPEGVKGDEKRLRQVLLNLLSNGIKYTHHGGVSFIVSYGDNQVFIAEIKDTGEGIALEKQNNIFEAFTQVSTHRNYIEGTGLGLPITKQLVELMHGRISLQSEPGKGSIFRIEIPLKPYFGIAKTSEADEIEIKAYKGTEKTILITDDNQANLAMLSDLLESVGFRILNAQNGQEAIEKTKSFKPDLLILDFLMPELDGHDTLLIIRQDDSLKNQKVIGLSATMPGQKKYADFVKMCNEFIQKPVDNKILFQHIKNLLKIEWTMVEAKQAIKNKTKAEITHTGIEMPSSEILEEIVMFAKMGAFTKIENMITEKEKKAFPEFYEKLSNFAGIFDDDGMIEFINKNKKIDA